MTNALEAWLQQATRCLAVGSAARVRSEIGEHFAATREEALHAGATHAVAERTALAALGSAREANLEYRKVLLTPGDARLLQEGNREAQFVCSNRRLRLALSSLPGIALVASAAMLYDGKADIARAMLLGSIVMSFAFVVPFLPIYTASRSRVVRVAKWVALATLPLVALGPQALHYSWLLCAMLWPVASIEWRRAVLRRKMPISQWPKQLYL